MTRTSVPPAILAAVSLLLATLWGFAVFGGWSRPAFCAGLELSPDCADRLAPVASLSELVALVAAGTMGFAWFARRESLYGVAVAAWIAALAVLLFGGLAVR